MVHDGPICRGFRAQAGSVRRRSLRFAGQFRFVSQSCCCQRSYVAETRRRRLKPGDEVITVAAGFPTTVNPIIQNRLVPVFVDVTLPTYEIDVSQLEAARSEKTRAIIVAHTLGNVFDLDAVWHLRRSTISG